MTKFPNRKKRLGAELQMILETTQTLEGLLGSSYRLTQASSHIDFNGNTISYEYDSMKREVLKKYPDNKTVSTLYNARGHRLRVVYELGTRRFEYDLMGRLTRDNKEDGQWIAYKYDIESNLIEISYTGGHVVSYAVLATT